MYECRWRCTSLWTRLEEIGHRNSFEKYIFCFRISSQQATILIIPHLSLCCSLIYLINDLRHLIVTFSVPVCQFQIIRPVFRIMFWFLSNSKKSSAFYLRLWAFDFIYWIWGQWAKEVRRWMPVFETGIRDVPLYFVLVIVWSNRQRLRLRSVDGR